MNPVGKFVPSEKLGAGASGEVWKARDTALGRWVALKFLKGGDEDEIARFQREAQVAGRLSHPNIAAIHEVGETDGRRYIAMQLIEGRTLRGWPVAERRRAVTLIRDAARAVAYAHAQGVVHRDLKPENLMVAGDHVYVMDFGLARPAAGAGVSVSGAILGTPGYMPPEQARGEKADARSDVYGLGATLYTLLTGGAPFDGASVYETLRKVQEEEPRPPGTDADLDAIVLRCLEKDRARRYASATELAEDLSRWLAGEPVLARAPSMAYRVRKAVARRRSVLIAASAVAAVSVAIVLVLLLPRLTQGRRVVDLWSRVAPLMSEAEANARVGEIERARKKLDDAIRECERSPDLAQARYFAARLRRMRGDAAGARRELDRALELAPSLAEARLERGLMGVAEYRHRLTAVPQTTDLVPERRPWRADEIRRLEAGDAALAAVRRQAEEDLDVRVGEASYARPLDVRYGRAELTRLRGDAEDAEKQLREILSLDPLYVAAAVSLAQLLWGRDLPDEALATLTEAARRHQGDADVQFMLGLLLRTRNRSVEAIAAFTASLRVRQNPVVLHHRGMACAETGDETQALRDFDRALALEPRAYAVLASRAWCRHGRRELAEARRDLDAALAINPRYAMAWTQRGIVRAALRDFEGAFADFARSLEIAPGHVPTYVQRGVTRAVSDDLEGAIADWTEAIRLSPDALVARLNRAQAYGRRGDRAAALRDYDVVLRIDPRDPVARRSRAELRIAAGDFSGAIEDIDALEKPEAQDFYARGFARYRLGARDAAERDLRHALDIAPSDWPGREAASGLLEQLRR